MHKAHFAEHRAEDRLGGGVRADLFLFPHSDGNDPKVLCVGGAGIHVAEDENDLWEGSAIVVDDAAAAVVKVETWQTGGGCMADVIFLKDGRTIGVTEDLIVLYPNADAFYDEDACGADTYDTLPTVDMIRMQPSNCMARLWGGLIAADRQGEIDDAVEAVIHRVASREAASESYEETADRIRDDHPNEAAEIDWLAQQWHKTEGK